MGEARPHITNIPATHPGSPVFVQDQLIDVFKSVGQVVGFRCVSDQPYPPFVLQQSHSSHPVQSRV